MKQTLFILLFASLLQAQTTTKTYVLGTDNVTYFEVTTVTQEDESATTTKVRVGPAASLAADQADKIEAKSRELANAAFAVSRSNARLAEINTVDADILALTTVRPLKTIQARYASSLTAPGWTIDKGAGAGFEALVFTINAQNNLRYSIAGSATKAAIIYGDVLTLSGYPSAGSNTDFYLAENGKNYFSLPNRSEVIKKP